MSADVSALIGAESVNPWTPRKRFSETIPFSRHLDAQDQAHLIGELTRRGAIDADSASRLQNLNMLQRIVTQAAEEVQNNPALMRRLLFPDELRTPPQMRALNMGKAIERRVDQLIGADPHLQGVFLERQISYRDNMGKVVGRIRPG